MSKPGNTNGVGRVWAAAMRLARRPQGATQRDLAEAAELKAADAGSRLAQMVRTGRLWKQKLPGEATRFFVKEPFAAR